MECFYLNYEAVISFEMSTGLPQETIYKVHRNKEKIPNQLI